jgi:hypothetical protein
MQVLRYLCLCRLGLDFGIGIDQYGEEDVEEDKEDYDDVAPEEQVEHY